MTRRITLNPRIGDQFVIDFKNNWIVVKDGTELKEFKAVRSDFNPKKYTVQQLESIHHVNTVLIENNQKTMTEEEIEYLLYPFGKDTISKPNELQALAGFEVRKEIINK
jgi:hypothetical protein